MDSINSGSSIYPSYPNLDPEGIKKEEPQNIEEKKPNKDKDIEIRPPKDYFSSIEERQLQDRLTTRKYSLEMTLAYHQMEKNYLQSNLANTQDPQERQRLEGLIQALDQDIEGVRSQMDHIASWSNILAKLNSMTSFEKGAYLTRLTLDKSELSASISAIESRKAVLQMQLMYYPEGSEEYKSIKAKIGQLDDSISGIKNDMELLSKLTDMVKAAEVEKIDRPSRGEESSSITQNQTDSDKANAEATTSRRSGARKLRHLSSGINMRRL